MQLDEDLPFGYKISQHAVFDMFSLQAHQNFQTATKAAQTLCKESCENRSEMSENDVLMSSRFVKKVEKNSEKEGGKKKIGKENNAKTIAGDKNNDISESKVDGLISLSKISKVAVEAIHVTSQSFQEDLENSIKMRFMKAKKSITKPLKTSGSKNKKNVAPKNQNLFVTWNQRMPMPESIKLDQYLVTLIDKIELNESKQKLRLGLERKRDKNKSIELDLDQESLTYFGNKLYISTCEILYGTYPSATNLIPSFSNGANEDHIFHVNNLSSSRNDENGDTSCRNDWNFCIPSVLTKFGLSGLIYADEELISSVKTFYNSMSEIDEFRMRKNVENSSIPAAIKNIMPMHFFNNREDRARICMAAFQFGSPLFQQEQSFSKVHSGTISALFGDEDDDENIAFEQNFFQSVSFIENSSLSLEIGNAGNVEMVETYFNTVLLPHCLELCLRDQGEPVKHWDQKYSIEKLKKSLIPDPCVHLNDHAQDAVKIAVTILRRSKLMKAIRYIVGGGVPGALITSFLRSAVMRKNLMGLPIWWCPWIHDLALLVYAATHGLFSIILDKSNQVSRFTNHKIFGKNAIETHIRTVFLEGRDGFKPTLPQSILSSSSSDQKESWLEFHAQKFPGTYIIERRLAFICSSLTTMAAEMSAQNKMAEWRFENFPMFDHNDSGNALFPIERIGNTPLCKSLLRVVEDEANDDANNL